MPRTVLTSLQVLTNMRKNQPFGANLCITPGTGFDVDGLGNVGEKIARHENLFRNVVTSWYGPI